ncbi:hypothetical protein MBLNU457_g0018t1 [Dothideomycetes sp. NU457]
MPSLLHRLRSHEPSPPVSNSPPSPGLLHRLRSNSIPVTTEPEEEKPPTYHAATALAPRRAPTWTEHNASPPQLSETHNELILRAPNKTLESDLTDHSYTIYDGDVPLYTIDLNPSSDEHSLTLHAGHDITGALLAGASYKPGGKEMRFSLSSHPDTWTPVHTNVNKTHRTFSVPNSARTFVAKNTTDPKLGCSGLSEFDQTALDANTDELCAVFLWNTQKASFTHERKRATVRWEVELSREEQLALIVVFLGWKERKRGKTPRGFFGNIASGAGGGWSISGSYYG